MFINKKTKKQAIFLSYLANFANYYYFKYIFIILKMTTDFINILSFIKNNEYFYIDR